jgi:hypothetical protein
MVEQDPAKTDPDPGGPTGGKGKVKQVLKKISSVFKPV